MNKAELNNEIVLMRKTVRQAKVHIIRKLVREIRILKEKKNPEGSDKFKAKADRLYEELTIIKKLDNDIISKHALTLTEDPKKILSKAESTNDRALNRFAVHKSVIDKVKSIRDKYNLNENIDKVLEPGKRKARKIKHIETKAKKKELRKENAKAVELSKKREAWLEENNVKPMVAGEVEDEGEGDDEVSKFEVIEEKKNKPKKVDIKEKFNNKDLDENKSKIVEEEEEDDLLEDSEESEEERITKDNNNEEEIEETKTVDDFFITDRGTHYESTYVPKPVKEQIHDDGLNRQQRRAQQFGNVVKRKPKKFKNESFVNNDDKKKMKFNDVKVNKIKEKKDFGKKVVEEVKPEVSLHPSWEAKKKLKPQITAFQGKKIVFDD